MKVYDAEDRLATILTFDVLADRTEKVAEMLSTRRLDAREDAHGGRRVAASALGALLAILLLAVPAQAAYAPKLTVKVTPSTPSTPAAFVSTISQAPGEPPSKTVTVRLPPEMGFNVAFTTTKCTDAEEAARNCPASSKLGTAEAVANIAPLVNVTLRGTVHLGTAPPSANALKVIVFLDNAQFRQHQTLEGLIHLVPAGAETTFDNLPTDFSTPRFMLSFDGDPARTLLATPATCGPHVITAFFTGKSGQKATSSDTFTTTGCPNYAPAIDAIRLVPARFRRPAAAKLRVRLSEAGRIVVRVKRRGKTVRLRSYKARQGLNVVKPLAAKMKAGRYTLYVKPVDVEKLAGDVEAVPFRVLASRKK